MDWYDTVFELIDMRSFSNLWYWIALAVVWSSASHWVLGVPFDMVQRAKRQGGQAEIDLMDLTRVNVNRILYINSISGLWILGVVCCLLTVLFGVGFFYGVEFCQAVFLLAFPMSMVGLLSVRTAHILRHRAPDLSGMTRIMNRHRFITQVIGMLAIFSTAVWGMWQNMSVGALGG
ncbi:component of SufBCD complex [Actibacterium ureilyticum]|uniref:component of SufBCD complex n=1 Tax=Actibacterium ureilyticum TaxID=1590614 RepID=UPI000BAB23F2|nr:component of SufBCD complex [Actibacterium ureilyticum]